ncbi:MAG: IS110 family transposase [Candidatus Cloacimonas sp.]|jgi:transposase|nr:IS110 family transposase [Candidatus Cloacimonas sp.]
MKTSLYLGIDVSKGYADFCLLNAARKVVGKPFQLFDIDEGYEALEQYLENVVKTNNPEQIYAAVESTGTYENHWLGYLYSLSERFPIKVARLNPLGVSKSRQADMKVQITDRTSSEAIARYLINHADIVEYYKPDSYDKYRACLSHLMLLTKQKVQLINKLRQHLYLYFPEILPYCRNTLPEYVLTLLERYPSAAAMSKARQTKNNSIAYFTPSDWQALKERCKLGQSRDSGELVELMITSTVKRIQAYTQEIDKIYDLLFAELPQDKLKILMSMPGIAKKSAVTLLCVIGDVSRFDGPHQIVGYFGLYPVIKESGDLKKKPHMSKKGNVLLRKTLYMCAMVACHHDPYLSAIYRKSVEKGMTGKAAICKVMKKMLRMLYGMLKDDQAYNPQVDTTYREKYEQRKKSHNLEIQAVEKKELELSINLAPISKKNAHIRKEQTGAAKRTRSSGKQPAAPSDFLPKTG